MLSRRSFLKSTLGAGVALARRKARHRRRRNPPGKRTIVDAQVHHVEGLNPRPPVGSRRKAAACRNHSPSRGWFP